MLRALLLLLLCSLAFPVAAQPVARPRLPCDGMPLYPPYGPVDGAPMVAGWLNADLRKLGWQPPVCLGWQGDSRLVAALAARFRAPQSLDGLAGRLADISHHSTIRFWAITRQTWRPLAISAWAVEGPDGKQRIADPPANALQPGRDFYYVEETDLAGRAIFRLHVIARSTDRLVLETENVTPIDVAIVTLFQPGALQVATFLERLDGDVWGLYEITRAAANSSSMVSGYLGSYLNRLEAIRRLLSGQPSDRDPPIAPW